MALLGQNRSVYLSLFEVQKAKRKKMYCFFLIKSLFYFTASFSLNHSDIADDGRVYRSRWYELCIQSMLRHEVSKFNGFTFGITFASKNFFFFKTSLQLFPCDNHLGFPSTSQISIFRAKVNEISFFTINFSSFCLVSSMSLYFFRNCNSQSW